MKIVLALPVFYDSILSMYIRRTTTKKAQDGTRYPTFRIVTSERVMGKVKQRTLLNIGSVFELRENLWSQLCKRIGDIINGRLSLIQTNHEVEKFAQEFAARIIAERSVSVTKAEKESEEGKYEEIDVSTLEMHKPRSVGVEHLALHAMQMLELPDILKNIGFTPSQSALSLAGIVGRMAKPGSERSTWQWLTKQSALGELLEEDFTKYSSMGLYRASDKLLQNKKIIEERLFTRIRSLFSLQESVVLYDLTNTYFEGTMKSNAQAVRGFSKEKRFDCPLLTLGLVLDGSGFVKRSKVFAGNASEAATVQIMLKELHAPPSALVVLDRGTATKSTLEWLVNANYCYVVVSRERARIFEKNKAVTIQTAQKEDLHVYRELNEDKTEARMYCYSPRRAAKEEGITNRFATQFEEGLQKLADAITKPRTNKRKDAILLRIGRLAQKCKGISQHYSITVTDNAETKSAKDPLLATAIHFEKLPVEGSSVTHPGVCCIRTNALCLDAKELWKTYVMLTDLEAVFRSLKSELGLRPVYHQTAERAEGHLFITVLAYQCVQVIRNKLKSHKIHESWQQLRTIMSTQQRVSTTFRKRNGATLHIRKTTLAEAQQLQIYNALNLDSSPGGVKRYAAVEKTRM
jgi:transposase